MYIEIVVSLKAMLEGFECSLFTICGDACPLSCVNAEGCLTGWPNA